MENQKKSIPFSWEIKGRGNKPNYKKVIFPQSKQDHLSLTHFYKGIHIILEQFNFHF